MQARFNPCRDSAACIIVIQLQHRLQSCVSGGPNFFSCATTNTQPFVRPPSLRALPLTDESPCNPKSKTLPLAKETSLYCAAPRFGEPQEGREELFERERHKEPGA